MVWHLLPSGKLTVCYGTSPFLMGKSTISMAIFNSYVKLPEGICPTHTSSLEELGNKPAHCGPSGIIWLFLAARKKSGAHPMKCGTAEPILGYTA